MKKEEFCEILGEINEKYITEVSAEEKSRTFAQYQWGIIAACLCLVVIGVMMWNHTPPTHPYAEGTLIGAEEIYPTVMVSGQLYEWRKGSAIRSELPNNSVYYGDIAHVAGQTPMNDCEFVSVFSVSGQIYTVSEANNCVYLCLTTEWMNNTIVVFDLVTTNTPQK